MKRNFPDLCDQLPPEFNGEIFDPEQCGTLHVEVSITLISAPLHTPSLSLSPQVVEPSQYASITRIAVGPSPECIWRLFDNATNTRHHFGAFHFRQRAATESRQISPSSRNS